MVAGIFYNELFDCKKGRESIAVFLMVRLRLASLHAGGQQFRNRCDVLCRVRKRRTFGK